MRLKITEQLKEFCLYGLYLLLFTVSDSETISEILINSKITIKSLHVNISNVILMKKSFSKICTVLNIFLMSGFIKDTPVLISTSAFILLQDVVLVQA